MAQQSMQWTLAGSTSSDNLSYSPVDVPAKLGPDDVLVTMHAASLNYRDIGSLPTTQAKPNVIPGSDGAGVVLRVGPNVCDFRPGDKVIPHMVPVASDDFLPQMDAISGGLGQTRDGTLCESAVFSQHGLIRMPSHMSFEEAATLGCSGLTAWNALMGLRGREVKAGDYVLVQGTGGVSVAALQFAIAVGATVVATTGKEANRERLASLGASHVINYKSDPAWGQTARALTPGSRGFDHIVDVGAHATLRESFKAVRTDGIVSLVGVLGAGTNRVDVMEVLWSVSVARGVLLGSKAMFRDMVRFCEKTHVHPALDDVTFWLQDAHDAYKRLEKQQHFSKVVIKIR
ncbi:Alcohol dehydrogenase superfamily, zinc-type [Niveomyces insectorum RCEF 264]|uniref:Alcohol dehydrogenase superfamily, zinc-type n=1 Tax=Niveomyces insectorum RCEF 264 TaxID=1081102 RepID=A0A167XS01_9HYPO|nr:Alcohol dehydrogenase superfamily, zinc-type [Niveomyces insectorum RCEF 264]